MSLHTLAEKGFQVFKFSFVLFYRPQDEQIHHLKKEIKLIFACQKILYNFLNTEFCTACNRN